MATQSQRKSFEQALESTPGVYIPMLFKNITEEKLKQIFKDLDIFTPSKIDINPKKMANGHEECNAFIHVEKWHVNENAQRMRKMLMSDQEVKIVFNDPWFFICKRKHEEHEVPSTNPSPPPPPSPPFIDLGFIAPPPSNIKGVSRTPSPSDSTASSCPECEANVAGNQLMHTCIQRMMEEGYLS